MWGYLCAALELNSCNTNVLVEPFAGGASITLQMLKSGIFENAVLGEKDPLVASFWKVVFSDEVDWLIRELMRVEISLDKWIEFKASKQNSDRERALACLFLNRTSFSGIIAPGAGPIGGKNQESEYKIDCRFPRETLARRIRQANELRDKVLLVNSGDWKQTIEESAHVAASKSRFLYLDPPFYSKSERLYSATFAPDDHVALRDYLKTTDIPWLLSYDVSEEITSLYSENGTRHVDLLYSAAGSSNQVRASELILTNLSELPKKTRLWRTSDEW